MVQAFLPQLPYRRIAFSVGSSYHVGWKLRDLSGKGLNLLGATIEFAVYAPGTPITPTAVPWLTKTNAAGGGLVVMPDNFITNDGTVSLVRADFAPQDTFNQIGVFPWEMKGQLADAPDWRMLSRGNLIIYAARLDP